MDEMKNDIIAIVECGQSVANMILLLWQMSSIRDGSGMTSASMVG